MKCGGSEKWRLWACGLFGSGRGLVGYLDRFLLDLGLGFFGSSNRQKLESKRPHTGLEAQAFLTESQHSATWGLPAPLFGCYLNNKNYLYS